MSRCTNCLKEVDAHIAPSDEKAVPREGDLSICWYCGEISVFDGDKNLSPISKETYLKIKKNEPDTFRELVRMSKIIQERVKLS